jgi:hypothetical protein
MQFRIASAAGETGRLLHSLVAELLPAGLPEFVVCYGTGYSGSLPALNALCNRNNKLEQARILRNQLNSLAINPLLYRDALEHSGPLLGRCLTHSQGRDIRVVLEKWQLQALQGVMDFFTPYTPSVAEWRTWVYRKRHLGSFRKVLTEPIRMRGIGRNHHNGFAFQRAELSETPEAVKQLARQAIAALRLDFGAVDILEKADGSYVALEVNSAPGVGDARRVVIQKMAHRIVRWAESGFPSAETESVLPNQPEFTGAGVTQSLAGC